MVVTLLIHSGSAASNEPGATKSAAAVSHSSREFKPEAGKLVKERGVSLAQAARELDVHENVLRKWVREAIADPQQVFLGQGVMKPNRLNWNV